MTFVTSLILSLLIYITYGVLNYVIDSSYYYLFFYV
nr:MAG TPA: hypothetical protein [Caudoviricetes sp.]